MQIKPFSQACENNKNPIFSILYSHLKNISHVVEIGSGTGQHATFFTEKLPHLIWQTTDQGEYFPILEKLIENESATCLPPALYLDVIQPSWPVSDCECIFTANTLHIMPWACVEKLFKGIGVALQETGNLFIYGPFKYDGQFTSKSNEAFDLHIKSNNPLSGIRDFEKIIMLAQLADLELITDYTMPANNRLLHFKRK